MDDSVIKDALSHLLGADLHEEWCMRELRAYYLRAQQELVKTHNFGSAFRNACYQGDTKINDVILDVGYLIAHEEYAKQCLTSFDVFIDLFKKGIIDVKIFEPRELSSDEIESMGSDYVDGKENILRDFRLLSGASQKKYLEPARVAIDHVYDRVMAGNYFTREEQNGDDDSILLAQNVILSYLDGLVDLNKVCDQYGISKAKRQFS